MKILTDLHHFDLYYSLQLLFEKRLQYELYRPIGMDWQTNGYWKIHGEDIEAAQCFLADDNKIIDQILSKYKTLKGKSWAVYSLHLPRIGQIINNQNGTYKILDKSKDIWQNGITLETFKNTKFDILIATTWAQVYVYKELIDKYQPQAKLIFQMGNNWDIPDIVNNIMCAYKYPALRNKNYIVYHQEFDLNIFKPIDNCLIKQINSYVWFQETEEIIEQLLYYIPDYSFNFIGKIFGPIQDIILKTSDLAKKIQNSKFTLLIKPGGEGYGHILFNSFACGIPLIIKRSDYINCAGDKMLEDGVTSIFTDNKTNKELSNIIKQYEDENKYNKLRENVFKKFKNIVNFDEEEIKIRKFLENLK